MISAIETAGHPEGDPGAAGAWRIVAAFLVALALHAGAFLALGVLRSSVGTPPGEQTITIDLAPQMIDAPAVEPAETSQPAGAPNSVEALHPPEEIATIAPEEAVLPFPTEQTEPVQAAPSETVAAVEPPPAAMPPAAVADTLPLAEAVEALAAEAEPDVAQPVPPPRTVVAQAQPTRPEPVERKPVVKPQPRPEPPRPARREQIRPAARAATTGAAGSSQREANRGAASRENAGGAAASAADPSAMNRYVAQLAAALKSRLRYPEAARAVGAGGVTTLRFTLHRSGRVLSASIARSAGHPALDQAALATASPGSMLPPAPDAVPHNQLTISVPLRFNMP